MNLLIAVLLGLVGLGLIAWGVVQAAVVYVFRAWFDRQLSGQVAQIGRDEVEKLIGKVRSEFVRRHILTRLKDTGGRIAVSYVRELITRYAHIGLAVAAIGFLAVIAAFNVSSLIELVWSGRASAP